MSAPRNSRRGRYAPLYTPPRLHRDHHVDADAAADAQLAAEEARDVYGYDEDVKPARWGHEW